MRGAGLTRQERSLVALMRLWAVLFAAAGAVFAAVPDYIPQYVADIGAVLLDWGSGPVKCAGRFWPVLSAALLFTLAYLCLIVQRNVVRNIGYARPVIFAKLASSAGFSACFFISGRQFIYLVAAAVDGAICLLTWRLYRNATRSRA